MRKSGLADSPFFTYPSNSLETIPSLAVEKSSTENEKVAEERKSAPEANSLVTSNEPRHHDTMTPRNHDTVVSSNHDTIIQTMRKAVKELGKEAATHRFTVEEKKRVLDLIYTYKSVGIKTSENEVARIAINYILEDYKQNGENSILDQTLKALNE